MNIAIIGYRGAGKTSVSKILARKIGIKLLSTDKMIVQKTKMEIKEIIHKYGWEKFRDIEEEIIRQIPEITGDENSVIDCGGGVVERESNLRFLKMSSKIVLLHTDTKIINKRISTMNHLSDRPALSKDKSSTEEIEKILVSRKEKYNSVAEFEIDTSYLSQEEIAEKIIRWYNVQ